MLRNATRELDRRQPVSQQIFQRPWTISRFLSQGCSRQAFAAQAAIDTRHEDAKLPALQRTNGFAEYAPYGRIRSLGTPAGRYSDTLQSHDGYDEYLQNKQIPHQWNAPHAALTHQGYQHVGESSIGTHMSTTEEISQHEWGNMVQNDTSLSRAQPRFLNPHRRRRLERQTRLSKSWTADTPNALLKGVLEPNKKLLNWKTQLAKTRSMRLQVVLLQMLTHKEASHRSDQDALLSAFPNPQEWRTAMSIVLRNGHTVEDLNYYLYILEGSTDELRCLRFFERNCYKPACIFHFLIRQTSKFTDVNTLFRLIEYYRSWSNEFFRGKEEESKLYSGSVGPMSPLEFNFTMRLLSYHCRRLEPRFVIKLSEVAADFIQLIETTAAPREQIYRNQCLVLNGNLVLFQPRYRMPALQRSSPNAFFWEAQRILLAKSGALKQPLLVDRSGFRSIRSALASLVKNQMEIHSSLRHASTWPPYLRPGDGMDELMDHEDNWSRTVRAGVLMQEAGFAKDEQDDALDILQGMAPDGTPSIQQRVSVPPRRNMSPWEASIRATRNAEEAWERFRHPPEADRRPTVLEYAAIFEKLVLREADSNARLLPGDKALNFPTQQEANLTDFERARLQPPSVTQLYQQMRLAGIRPKGNCLRILVANAESLHTAHKYLFESEEGLDVQHLMASEPDADGLKRIDMNLFSAYIQVLTRHESSRSRRHFMRAIDLLEKRLGSTPTHWAEFSWGIILKNLSQHHCGLRINLDQQLKLVLHIVERLNRFPEASLPMLVQLSKCLRKIVRHEIHQLWADVESGRTLEVHRPLRFLLERGAKHDDDDDDLHDTTNEELDGGPISSLLMAVVVRLKEVFSKLKAQEYKTKLLLGPNQVAILDRMTWRRDPARSEHAYQFMLSLAYVGEFQEMANTLSWLIGEWGHPETVQALLELDELPAYADFSETLCAFRLLAEPMLDEAEVQSLHEAISRARLPWTWPDDEAVVAYAQTYEDASVGTLAQVLRWIRNLRGVGEEDRPDMD